MAKPEKSRVPVVQRRIDKCWREALDLWGVNTTLSPPRPLWKKGEGPAQNEPLAYIDLRDRQVVVNFALVKRQGLQASLTAILAHEIGHHVRFPHSLGLAAKLEVLEKRLIPGLSSSLTNLFFDLQVNEVVGQERAAELAAVYETFAALQKKPDPLFSFYLAIYEDLWSLPDGSLLEARHVARLEKAYPGFRAEARMFAQTFFALNGVYLQFIYFCSRFVRFLPDPSKFQLAIPMACDIPLPTPDDFADAMKASSLLDDALEEAEQRGWIDPAQLEEVAPGDDAFHTIDSVCTGGHGRGEAEFRRLLVDRLYKDLVEQHIIDVPPSEPAGPSDPFIPTSIEAWDFDDDPKLIDWTQSVLAAGPLAGAMPLKRELEADAGETRQGRFPSVEIYLDTSGSMPDPLRGLNAMTLAAQVLSASAIRKQGRVRGVIYADGKPMVSDWLYDEDHARRFLLHYAGGGTHFPFKLLDRFSAERRDVVRVVISDDGFLMDLERREAGPAMRRALERSDLFVALLCRWIGYGPRDQKVLNSAKAHPTFRLVEVPDLTRLATVAADLGRALFGDS